MRKKTKNKRNGSAEGYGLQVQTRPTVEHEE